MAIVVMVMLPLSAFAASTDPYGFDWHDDYANVWHVQFYDVDVQNGNYRIADRVILKGNVLYDMAGTVIATDVASYSEMRPTVAFDPEGRLYFIANNGELRMMETSLKNFYSVNAFKSLYIELDKQDLAAYAKNSNSASKTLSKLVFEGKYMRHEDKIVEKDGCVKMYAVNGDPEKIGYDAYYNRQVVVTTYCKDANVWVETVKRLISDSSKGGKFVGYSAQYDILVYDLNGKVLCFNYKDGYVKQTTLLKNVELYYFEKNNKGFISGIVTKDGKYNLSTEINFPGTINGTGENTSDTTGGNSSFSTDLVDDVKNFINKSMAYSNGNLIGTLYAKDKSLYWKDTKLSNSKGSNEFGISRTGTVYWINNDDCLYSYDGNGYVLIDQCALRLNYDDAGRVDSYKASNGKWYNLK